MNVALCMSFHDLSPEIMTMVLPSRCQTIPNCSMSLAGICGRRMVTLASKQVANAAKILLNSEASMGPAQHGGRSTQDSSKI